TSSGWNRVFLPGRGHGRPDTWQLAPGQEPVPVEPLEHQLSEVVQARLLEQRERAERVREATRQRLGAVVEVDQQGLVEARLDEAVGVSVVRPVELLAGEEEGDVLRQNLPFEVG